MVGVLQGKAKRPVLHPASIDEDHDALTVRARQLRSGDPAVDANPGYGRRVVELLQSNCGAANLRPQAAVAAAMASPDHR